MGPSINYVRIFSRFLGPPTPPVAHSTHLNDPPPSCVRPAKNLGTPPPFYYYPKLNMLFIYTCVCIIFFLPSIPMYYTGVEITPNVLRASQAPNLGNPGAHNKTWSNQQFFNKFIRYFLSSRWNVTILLWESWKIIQSRFHFHNFILYIKMNRKYRLHKTL